MHINKLFAVLLGLAMLAAGCVPQHAAATSHSLLPTQVADAFYHWYLGYPGNPLADGAYRESEHLSRALIARVDEMLTDGVRFDPFLCAQAVPDDFCVAAGDAANRVEIQTVWNAGTEYESIKAVRAALVQEDSAWKIDTITCPHIETAPAALQPPGPPPTPISTVAPTAAPPTAAAQAPAPEAPRDGWQTFQDTQYGYRISYPADWTWAKVELSAPALVAPVVQSAVFGPSSMAEALNPSGPPDPSKPPAIPPLNLEVSQGAPDEYRRMYPEPTASETLNINGQQVTREELSVSEDICIIRYMFQHPTGASLRVTITDNISGFPDRAAGSEAMMQVIADMLQTFAFE